MPLETASTIADLVITNPVGASDTPAALDDHIRLIKKVLKADALVNADIGVNVAAYSHNHTGTYQPYDADTALLDVAQTFTAKQTFTGGVDIGSAFSHRNKIINGNFGVNQRGVSGTVTLSAGVYGHDRWKAGASGCTYTFATSDNVTTITISAGSLMQVIEGSNLLSGTHVLSWTGTAQGKVDSGAYGVSGLTGTAVGGTNQTIEFGTGTVSKVQYEPGSVATPFEHRPIGTELTLCQRYYQDLRGTGGNTQIAFGVLRAGGVIISCSPVSLPVQMRAAPTMSGVTSFVASAPTNSGEVGVYNEKTGAYTTITGGLTNLSSASNQRFTLTFQAGTSFSGTAGDTLNVLAAGISLSAEL